MNKIGTLDWGDWFYGLFAAIIGGGMSAITSGVVVNMVDPDHFKAGSHDFYTIVWSMFAANAIISGAMFLRQKPLPTVKVTTVEERSPHTTVVTTTQEIPVVPPEIKP